MQELLHRIAIGLQAGHYTNERAVSTSIVVPILRLLGWDDADPVSVRPEYGTGNGRVDYALFPRAGAPAVFLEVKGVGKSSEADQQLFQYAFHEGAQIAVLTDGRVWSFYLPGEHGSYDDRRVYQLDVLERDVAECELRFRRYLDRSRVVSGIALQEAKADYTDKASRRLAEDMIPKAWFEMLSEPDAELLNILSERTEAMSGHKPTDAAIEAFLQSATTFAPDRQATVPLRTRRLTSDTVRRPSVPAPVAQALPVKSAQSLPAGKPNIWKVGTATGAERDQVTAMIAFLSALFVAYPDKHEQMAAAVRTRSRNNIARSVADVYPNKPEIAAKHHRQLPHGWYVGTNESSGTKTRIAMLAARACGLAWGQDALLQLWSENDPTRQSVDGL